MKKLFSLLVALFFVGCLQANAEKNRVFMKFYQTGNVNRSTTVRRSPMFLPIEIVLAV